MIFALKITTVDLCSLGGRMAFDVTLLERFVLNLFAELLINSTMVPLGIRSNFLISIFFQPSSCAPGYDQVRHQ